MKTLYLIVIICPLLSCSQTTISKNSKEITLSIYRAIIENDLNGYLDLCVDQGKSDNLVRSIALNDIKKFNAFFEIYGFPDTINVECKRLEMDVYNEVCKLYFYFNEPNEPIDTIANLVFLYETNRNGKAKFLTIFSEIIGIKINNAKRFKNFIGNIDSNYLAPLEVYIQTNSQMDTLNRIKHSFGLYDSAISLYYLKRNLYNFLNVAQIEKVNSIKMFNPSKQYDNFVKISTRINGIQYGIKDVEIICVINNENMGLIDDNFIFIIISDANSFFDKPLPQKLTFLLLKESNAELSLLLNKIYNNRGIGD